MKRDEDGLIYIDFYMDDNLLIGNDMAINETINAHRYAGIVLYVNDLLEDHLSCAIKLSRDYKSAWLGQSHII